MNTKRQVYKSKFLSVEYDKDNSLIVSTWSIKSVQLKSETLKEEMLERMKYIEKYRPRKVLVNAKFFFFRLPPSIQTWMNEEILNRYYEAGIEKMAFIISNDLVAQISIEQAIQENETSTYQIRYFDSIEKAKVWLCK